MSRTHECHEQDKLQEPDGHAEKGRVEREKDRHFPELFFFVAFEKENKKGGETNLRRGGGGKKGRKKKKGKATLTQGQFLMSIVVAGRSPGLAIRQLANKFHQKEEKIKEKKKKKKVLLLQ
jgi:hypothetical protein